MISQKTVQNIFETAKIEEVVGDFVNLRRRGVNLIGLCPFHNEKTPSFTVSPTKGIYKCFGCGEGGNSVNFVMTHENFTYPEALRYLAKKYGIKVEETITREEDLEERKLLDSLFIINEFAQKYYENNLFNTDIGRSVGLSYFKERGFREDTIKKFGLGLALDKSDHFTLTAVQKGYKLDLLKKVGLTSRYGRDFFRNRVQFPIHNLSGKVIGFGGRILVKNKKLPKYINTPESEIYNKSKVLYGIFLARKAIRKLDNCLMVEGYTDVISLSQAGIENVVSSSGTSLTVGQIRLVKRYTPNITILYDGDAAGIKAALRGLDLVLEQDMNVKVVQLPEGEDPDSYLQKVGATHFKTYISENANDFILFKTNLLLEDAKNDPIKKTKLIKDIVGSIARIPDPIKRSVYLRECSVLLKMDERVLVAETNKVVRQLISKQQKITARQKAQNKPQSTPQKQTQKQPSPQDVPWADFIPPPDGFYPPTEENASPPTDTHLPNKPTVSRLESSNKKIRPTYNDEFYEKEMVRVLMEFGSEIIEEEVTVAEYVLANMEDILEEFDSPLYGRVMREAYENLVNGKVLTHQQYIQHPDETIQKLAVNFAAFPYDYSRNWEDKWDKPLQTQPIREKNFKRDAISAVNQFKLRKVQKVYEKNQKRLKDLSTADFVEMMKILKVQKKLGEIRKELAALSRTVVVK